jgi:VWFA-related protein
VLRRWFEWLLIALVCARVIAGCGPASQPAPGSSSASGATVASPSSQLSPVSAPLELCRIPGLAPADVRSASGYTQLDISVTDPGGTPIAGLKQGDFKIQSGSMSLPIVYFRQGSNLVTPVSLVIVGDVSASMYRKTVVSSADELEKARGRMDEAAGQLNKCDETALVLIGGTYLPEIQETLEGVTLTQPFTTRHYLVLRKMYSVIPSGRKQLSDGIRMGQDTLAEAHYPSRALLLMTDGLDQTAIDQSAPFLAHVRDSGVTFRVVGIGDPEAQDGLAAKLRGSTRLDRAAVKKLAAEGGGQALFAKPVDSDEGASLAEAVTTIGKQLGDRYVLGIDAPPGKVTPTVTLPNHPDALVRVDVVPSEVLAEAAARPAGPQREVGTAKSVVAPAEIRKLAGYTELAATVAKPDGTYVGGLTKSDFNLSVDGSPQPIDFFRAGEESPATVGILVDTSGSMTPKLPQARAAIEQFVKTLGAQDQVFLFAFSSKPFLLQSLTNDHDALIQRLDLLHAYGQTALFDTILQGIVEAQQSHNQRKVLLVITDGMDNTSRSSADDVVQAAKSSGVLVYSIGIGDPNLPKGQAVSISIGPFVQGGDDSERVDAATLSRLAAANGSKSYVIQKVGDGTALKKACEQIADDVHERHSYAIGFVAHASANYAPTTMPIALQVPAHNDYVVEAPKSIPVPPAP